MSKELRYVENPWRSRFDWALLYVLIGASCLAAFYLAANHIRTQTLPVGGVDLSVQYSKYLLGEPISFTISNHFNSTVYIINKCPEEPLGVYQLQSNKWVRIHDKANKSCNAEDRQVGVPPNRSLTMSLASWPHLFDAPGKYRLVVLIESYDALPYQDFEIISPPAPIAATQNPLAGGTSNDTSSSASKSSSKQPTSSSTSTSTSQGTNVQAPKPAAVTYTVHVTSGGIYDTANLVLNTGDSVAFVYSPPYGDEVRTHFYGSPAVSSVTVDSEFRSRTRTFSSPGTWSFKADDHYGNTGVITVK